MSLLHVLLVTLGDVLRFSDVDRFVLTQVHVDAGELLGGFLDRESDRFVGSYIDEMCKPDSL